MDEKEAERGGGAVEASGDAIVIGESIYAGLSEIAGAIEKLAKALTGDDEPPVESETYLDGKPRR